MSVPDDTTVELAEVAEEALVVEPATAPVFAGEPVFRAEN